MKKRIFKGTGLILSLIHIYMCRRDRDGNTRPIHTKNAEKVLHFERDSQWVKENIAIEPILIEEGEGYKEYIAVSYTHRRWQGMWT